MGAGRASWALEGGEPGPESCAGQRGVFSWEAAGWDLAFRRHLGVEDRLRGAKWEAEGTLRRGGSDTVELAGGTGQRQQVGERRDPKLGYEWAVMEPGTSP